jgi:hypothetical protein
MSCHADRQLKSREPLPEPLEAIANEFLKEWRNLDTRDRADRSLSELDNAQRSAVIRRAQRLSSPDPKRDRAASFGQEI